MNYQRKVRPASRRLACAAAFAFTLTGGVSFAGLFDQLKDVANGALATYSQVELHRNAALLSDDEIAAGLREMLAVGADQIVMELGRQGGYGLDSGIRIRLPTSWDKARDIASRIGYGGEFQQIEAQLNRAAESAAPAARDLVQDALLGLEFRDARALLFSGDKAATTYLKYSVGQSLTDQLTPIVRDQLTASGVHAECDRLARKIRRLPLVADLRLDLTDHVVEEGLAGFFRYLGEQESAIRQQPQLRTTTLLQKVFG